MAVKPRLANFCAKDTVNNMLAVLLCPYAIQLL
jgi:hypothetical protein